MEIVILLSRQFHLSKIILIECGVRKSREKKKVNYDDRHLLPLCGCFCSFNDSFSSSSPHTRINRLISLYGQFVND